MSLFTKIRDKVIPFNEEDVLKNIRAGYITDISQLSEKAKKSPRIAKEFIDTVKSFRGLMQFSQVIFDDKEFAKFLLLRKPEFYSTMPVKIRNDLDIAKMVIEDHPREMFNVGSKLIDNMDLWKIALKQSPSLLVSNQIKNLSFNEENREKLTKLLSTKETFLELARFNGDLLSIDECQKFTYDESVVSKVIEMDPYAFQWASLTLKMKPEIQFKLLMEAPQGLLAFFNDAFEDGVNKETIRRDFLIFLKEQKPLIQEELVYAFIKFDNYMSHNIDKDSRFDGWRESAKIVLEHFDDEHLKELSCDNKIAKNMVFQEMNKRQLLKIPFEGNIEKKNDTKLKSRKGRLVP